MPLLQYFRDFFKKKPLPRKTREEEDPHISEEFDDEIIPESQVEASEEEEEYEIVEREFLPAKKICPDCGGITLEGLDFCDKCGGEL